MDDELYGVAELAKLGGVTRRTVRYYIQENLLPPPRGVGRGKHYGNEHLERLLRVKTLQEQGLTLSQVRAVVTGQAAAPAAPGASPEVTRSAWTRIELAPGIELMASSEWLLPSPGKVNELAAWCRRHFRRHGGEGSDE